MKLMKRMSLFYRSQVSSYYMNMRGNIPILTVRLVIMTTTKTLCSQTILQKASHVSSSGPWKEPNLIVNFSLRFTFTMNKTSLTDLIMFY